MSMTRSEATEKQLELEGWVYDRTVTNRSYKPAGSVDQMQTRGGREYVRVYTSECKGREKWQLTHVYKRRVSDGR